jgi:hypothetical protein
VALTISKNPVLTTVSAFESIQYFLVGSVIVEDNAQLVSLETFNNVQELQQDISVSRNNALMLIDSFASLEVVGGSFTIQLNPSLLECSIPAGLSTVGGSVLVSENAAAAGSFLVSGPTSLHTVGGSVEISQNNMLADVTGFDFDGDGSRVQQIVISANVFGASGGQIAAFSGLDTVVDGVAITDNELLQSISGFKFNGAGSSSGDISIVNNNGGLADFSLSVDGFTALGTVGTVVVDNSQLGSISKGFAFVSGKVGDVTISRNLPSDGGLELDGFTGLSSSGTILVEGNTLINLNGFIFTNGVVGDVLIQDNTAADQLEVGGFRGIDIALSRM